MRPPSSIRPSGLSLPLSIRSPGFYLRYLYSFGIIVVITGGGLFIRDLIAPTNLVMPYLLGVVTIAVLWGRGPAVFASVLGVIAFDFFLVPPYLTFVVEDTEYVITFLALFIVGVFISSLTAQIKDQMLAARERETQVTALYRLSQDLAVVYRLPDVLAAIAANVRSTLGREVRIFLLKTDFESPENPAIQSYPEDPEVEIDAQTDEALRYTLQSGAPSGAGTPDFSDLADVTLPLVTNRGTIGAIRILRAGPISDRPEEDLQSLEAFASLSALAIERVYLGRQASQAQLLKAKGELQATLLNSVSHDFRTPLVTITGTLSSLDSGIDLLDSRTQQMLVRQALRESEKLNRLVSNLLNISRLESGALQLQLEPVDLQDLVGATLEDMKNRIDREIRVAVPEHIPLVQADFVLVQQALMNLLENALKFSPDGSPIDIAIEVEGRWVSVAVADQGEEIPEDEIPRIFDKFYRSKSGGKSGGTGLGLAIVKGVVDAHSARIDVSRREGGGMVFRIAFPHFELAREAVRAG